MSDWEDEMKDAKERSFDEGFRDGKIEGQQPIFCKIHDIPKDCCEICVVSSVLAEVEAKIDALIEELIKKRFIVCTCGRKKVLDNEFGHSSSCEKVRFGGIIKKLKSSLKGAEGVKK